ncbi:MAG: DUF1289 domain-containing protein [Pseudomonadota bacterium]
MHESPCTGVCRLNPENVCVGCGRTMGEISEWSAASEARHAEIKRSAHQRLTEMAPRG